MELEAGESYCEPVESSSFFFSLLLFYNSSRQIFLFPEGFLTKLLYSLPNLPCVLHTPLSRFLYFDSFNI
jgi:hypothetical protein